MGKAFLAFPFCCPSCRSAGISWHGLWRRRRASQSNTRVSQADVGMLLTARILSACLLRSPAFGLSAAALSFGLSIRAPSPFFAFGQACCGRRSVARTWRLVAGASRLPGTAVRIKQYQTGPSLRLAYLRLAGLAVLPFAWFSGFLPGHRLCPPPRYALLPSSALCPPLAGVVRSPPAVLVHSGGWTSGFQVHACGSA